MEYKIRTMIEEDYDQLEDFLYEAIFLPEGVPAPPRSILKNPDLQVYLNGFGSGQGDAGIVAEADHRLIGAIWSRIMNDYGHVDDQTPSLAISLYKEYRNKGIGTAMLHEMLKLLKKRGYRQVSLAVQKENYAVNMYRKAGFEVFKESDEEYIMVCKL